jgi:endo-1,4-beta-xylanase
MKNLLTRNLCSMLIFTGILMLFYKDAHERISETTVTVQERLQDRSSITTTNFKNVGSTGEGKILKMTIGAKENLYSRITNFNPTGRTLTWTSSNTSVVTVNNGIVTAEGFTNGESSTVSSDATGTAIITVTASGEKPNTDSFTINTTMESQIDMMNLPPLKDQFANYFLIGNIATTSDANNNGTSITNTRLTRHYNVLTSENDMKPSSYNGSRSGATVSGLTWTNSDRFVNAATVSGFKVHGHVLLWHRQNPNWINALNSNTGKEIALGAMRSYITQVVSRYKGKIYSWDVLNEVFTDSVSPMANWKIVMRTRGDRQGPNPWFLAIGSDFVFEGYKAARLADPGAILYYNDYNLDNVGKSSMVAYMVLDVNEAWKKDPKYDKRLLIEGIGMQSHHNTTVSVDAIQATLERFKPLGVKISISEIDLVNQSWIQYDSNKADNTVANTTVTNTSKLFASNLYGGYFKLFIQYQDIIDRVTFWGVYDEQSWRAKGLPLIFEGTPTSKAKPAYYKVVNSLE